MPGWAKLLVVWLQPAPTGWQVSVGSTTEAVPRYLVIQVKHLNLYGYAMQNRERLCFTTTAFNNHDLI